MLNIRTYTFSLTANVESEHNITGNVYAVIENTGEFSITFNDSNRFEKQSSGMGAKFDSEFGRVRLLSTTNQNVTVVLGFGSFEDARASVNATVNTTIAPSDTIDDPADISVGVSATQIVSANPNRKEVLINVPSSASQAIRVGGSAVARGAGLVVEPGSTISLALEAAVYGITNSTTGSVDVSVVDLTRS